MLRLEVSESSGDTGQGNVDDASNYIEMSEDSDQAEQDVVINKELPEH